VLSVDGNRVKKAHALDANVFAESSESSLPTSQLKDHTHHKLTNALNRRMGTNASCKGECCLHDVRECEIEVLHADVRKE